MSHEQLKSSTTNPTFKRIFKLLIGIIGFLAVAGGVFLALFVGTMLAAEQYEQYSTNQEQKQAFDEAFASAKQKQLIQEEIKERNSSPASTTTNKKQLIICTGPDKKQFQTTQKECEDFNRAWGNVPSSVVQPSQTQWIDSIGAINERLKETNEYYDTRNEEHIKEMQRINEEMAKLTPLPIQQEPLPLPTYTSPPVYQRICQNNTNGMFGKTCYNVCVINCY